MTGMKNAPDDTAGPLLQCIRELTDELRPGQPALRVDLDSVIDRELGIDSLGRAELFQRVEREFNVVLSEAAFGAVESPRDLLRAIAVAGGAADQPSAPLEVSRASGDEVDVPTRAATLVDVLAHHAAQAPDRVHVHLLADGAETTLTYGELNTGARRVAAGLRTAGLAPDEPVAIMLPTGFDYFFAFLGVLMAGGIPAPIYPPGRPAQLEEHLARHAGIVDNAGARIMVTVPEARPFAQLLRTQAPKLERIVSVEEISADPSGTTVPQRNPGDIAFLQYTSGSTGQPKGVVLSNANLLANIRVMGAALRAGPDDVVVSWLPLYHDMGLIGCWLGSLYHAAPLVLMSPLAFLARPERWFDAIERHGGTISGGPNFGYELCLRRVSDERLADLNLSTWRAAFNGAEAISPETLDAFSARFAAAGFACNAMMPVYGLAESCVGLAFPPLGRGPVIDSIDRETLAKTGEAHARGNDGIGALRVVNCGGPLTGHEIRIVDAAGRELPERCEGRLQFKGPSATSGYYRNADATAKLFAGDWLESGDLAYMAAGDIYITGRSKDLIIRGGRNIYPAEIEDAVGALDGVQKGNVAVFGSADPNTGTERLIVLAESRKRKPEDRAALQAEVTTLVTDFAGSPPDEVVLAPPRSVPKTSSGKVRRAASREAYEQGRIGEPARGLRLQVTRIALAGAWPMLRRGWTVALDTLYAGYALTMTGLLAVPMWLGVVLSPWAGWRWTIGRGLVRLLFQTCGIRLTVRGMENLPPKEQPFVLVSNHMSYLDGFVLAAAISRPVRFVVKAELQQSAVSRLPLNGLGVAYVERFDAKQGIADAERIAASAADGPPPVFFAEGTLTRAPGLLPFQMGAFLTAASGRLPVVPLTIRGTRAVLRDGSWLARRGRIVVSIGEPIEPITETDTWAAAVTLRDATRAEILRHCGEPDLAGERAEIFSG